MLLLSPRLLVAAATHALGTTEESAGARGKQIDLFLHEVHEPTNAPWDAAFVHHVGFWSHYDHFSGASSWPLPAFGKCDELAAYARERGVLLPDDCPAHGDVFVQWSPARKRYIRAGIVLNTLGAGASFVGDKPYIECLVIEGNSDHTGRLNGPSVVRIVRKLCPRAGDRFIRWTALDPRLAIADPMQSYDYVAGRIVIGPQRSSRRAA